MSGRSSPKPRDLVFSNSVRIQISLKFRNEYNFTFEFVLLCI